jgi:hypothetical protein
MKTFERLSYSLPQIAGVLDETLGKVTGEDVAFVLIAAVDNTAQYASNMSKEDVFDLISSLIDNWEQAHFPAHLNPDLKDN